MSLWNHFGPPSIFFTISPCDFVSFRMKLYVTSDHNKSPSLDWTTEECITDWTLRSNIRSTFLGDGAIEFQNFLQIFIEDCLGWDVKKRKPKCNGMFGGLLAFGVTVEEQARFTLHIHFLLWIKYFNSVRNNIFSEDPEVREKARNCMVEYVSKIMTASYPDLEVIHNKSRDVNEVCPGKMILVGDQEIRNIRHKTKFLEANVVVAKCNVCNQSFTTVHMVNNSLNIWKSKIPSENIYNFHHPILEERSDVYAMLFPYRNTALSKKKSDYLKEKY